VNTNLLGWIQTYLGEYKLHGWIQYIVPNLTAYSICGTLNNDKYI